MNWRWRKSSVSIRSAVRATASASEGLRGLVGVNRAHPGLLIVLIEVRK